MSIDYERVKEMIDAIYHMKEEMEVHDGDNFSLAYNIAEQLQEELEEIQEDLS